jgi:MFS family permease
VLAHYHSPALAGWALFLAHIPGLLLTPIVGALLDRQGRKRLIRLDYTVAASMLSLLGGLVLVGYLPPWLLLVIVAIGSLTTPLSESGARSLFPVVVPRAYWDRVNALDSASLAFATVAGPALAGLCYASLGAAPTFLITASVFVVANLIIRGMREPQHLAVKQEPLLAAAWESLRYVVRHRTLRGISITVFMSNVPYGILSVALPVLAFQSFHWDAGTVGLLWALAGVATIISGIVVGRFNSEGRERSLMLVGIGLEALCCLLILLQTPVALVAGLVIFGLGTGPYDLGLFAVRQRRTDPRKFGRVLAISMGLNFAGVPVGSAIAGVLSQWTVVVALGVAAAIALLGCVIPFLVIPRATEALTSEEAAVVTPGDALG